MKWLNIMCAVLYAATAFFYGMAWKFEGHDTTNLIFAIIWAAGTVVWTATTVLSFKTDRLEKANRRRAAAFVRQPWGDLR